MESQRVFFVADFASQTLKVPQQKMVETSYVITSLKKDSCLWRVHCVCVCITSICQRILHFERKLKHCTLFRHTSNGHLYTTLLAINLNHTPPKKLTNVPYKRAPLFSKGKNYRFPVQGTFVRFLGGEFFVVRKSQDPLRVWRAVIHTTDPNPKT